jgi:hypothetical protein
MKNKDQILLENLYSKEVLKEGYKLVGYYNTATNPRYKNQRNHSDIHTLGVGYTKQEALKIGIENFKESGIKINEPFLIFNKETNSYVYRVENVITKSKNITGKDTGKTEVLIINSLSGEIIERIGGLYGIILR